MYPQGAKCHVRCRGGFWLKGAYTRRCVTGGRWSGEEPICLREATTDPPYNPGNRHHARTRSFRFGWQNGKNTAGTRCSRDLSRGRKIETFIGKNFDFTSASASMSLGHRFASLSPSPSRRRAGSRGRSWAKVKPGVSVSRNFASLHSADSTRIAGAPATFSPLLRFYVASLQQTP